jgi:hypothetical protein
VPRVRTLCIALAVLLVLGWLGVAAGTRAAYASRVLPGTASRGCRPRRRRAPGTRPCRPRDTPVGAECRRAGGDCGEAGLARHAEAVAGMSCGPGGEAADSPCGPPPAGSSALASTSELRSTRSAQLSGCPRGASLRAARLRRRGGCHPERCARQPHSAGRALRAASAAGSAHHHEDARWRLRGRTAPDPAGEPARRRGPRRPCRGGPCGFAGPRARRRTHRGTAPGPSRRCCGWYRQVCTGEWQVPRLGVDRRAAPRASCAKRFGRQPQEPRFPLRGASEPEQLGRRRVAPRRVGADVRAGRRAGSSTWPAMVDALARAIPHVRGALARARSPWAVPQTRPATRPPRSIARRTDRGATPSRRAASDAVRTACGSRSSKGVCGSAATPTESSQQGFLPRADREGDVA